LQCRCIHCSWCKPTNASPILPCVVGVSLRATPLITFILGPYFIK
jgi:hypothetical protein